MRESEGVNAHVRSRFFGGGGAEGEGENAQVDSPLSKETLGLDPRILRS